MSQARIKVNGPVYGNFKERSYFHIDFKIAALLVFRVYLQLGNLGVSFKVFLYGRALILP